jgi:hypothetical protein
MAISKFDSVFDPAMSAAPVDTVAREVVEKFNLANMTMYLLFFDIVSSAIVPPFELYGKGTGKGSGGYKRKWRTAVRFAYVVICSKYLLHEDSIYFDQNTAVKIICPIHREITTIPCTFIRGSECEQCHRADIKLKCAEKFYVEVHRRKYKAVEDSVYVDSKEKVWLECKIHGLFEISPRKLLDGRGCKYCGGNSIELSEQRFNDEVHCQGYKRIDNSPYISRTDEVELMCFIHGSFFIKPKNLINRSEPACKNCALAVVSHAFYAEVELRGYKRIPGSSYISATDDVKLMCHTHGLFSISPTVIMRGGNCRKCSIDRIKKKCSDEFFRIAESKGYARLDISIYITQATGIWLKCPEHGTFSITPASLKNGAGCRYCGEYGFSELKPGILYYIEFFSQPGRSIFKIGITNRSVKDRYYGATSTPYSIIWEQKFVNGSDCRKWEKKAIAYGKAHRCIDKPVNGISNAELFDVNVFPTIEHLWDIDNES